MSNLSNYPPGCDASDYERWAGTDCDEEETCEECGDLLDDGVCENCSEAEEEDDDES